MTYIIPNRETKKINQMNTGDFSGIINESKNIDLTDEGYIKLSPTPFAIETTDDDSDFSNADVINVIANNIYVISSKLFYLVNTAFNKLTKRSSDTGIPSPATKQDIVYFNGEKVLSYNDSIYHATSSTWTQKNLSLDNTRRTILCPFDNKFSLLVGNANKVKLLNTSYTQTIELVLPDEYSVSSIEVIDDIAYIATTNNYNREAKLFLWNAETSGANNSFVCDSPAILSVKKFGFTSVILTGSGRLQEFNGSGFTDLAVLPIFNKNIEWYLNDGFFGCSNRGMFVNRDNIYIFITSRNTSLNNQFYSPFKSGVWIYNKKTGLSNYTSLSYNTIVSNTITTSNVDISTNIITVTSAPVTGTPILYDDADGTSIPELKEGVSYFAIKVSATTIKLAKTLRDANNGIAIDLTGTGNNSQVLRIISMNDYGWSLTAWATGNEGSVAFAPANAKERSYDVNNYLFFSGVIFSKQNTSTAKTVFCSTMNYIPNRGYFTTPKLQAENIEDSLDRFTIKYKELRDGEKIIVKYKNKNRVGYPIAYSRNNTSGITGTWVDTNTFTTTGDLSNVSVGDEVELVSGVGAGFSAHIVSISYNAGTYTVNLSEDFIFAVSGDKFYFKIDNWTFVKEITNETQNGDGYDSFSFDAQGKSIEFKVEMFGIGVTIEELIVDSAKLK